MGVYKGGNIPFTTEQYIEKAKKIHRDKYDYSFVDYKNAKTKIIIKCKECGFIFPQNPASHLRGCGCPNCHLKKITSIEFHTEYDFCKTKKDYQKEYLKLIKRNSEEGELHHILPKSMFPLWKDRKSNLVKLSYEDHYKAHYLLYKIYDNKEMAMALSFMINTTGKQYNPELYKELNSKQNKKIYCFELNKIYSSISEARMEHKKIVSNFSEACKNWKKTVNGFHWCYLEDKDKAVEFWENNNISKKNKKVYCFELDEIYNSAMEAAKTNNLKRSSRITHICKNKKWKEKSANYHWCFFDDKNDALKFWLNKE